MEAISLIDMGATFVPLLPHVPLQLVHGGRGMMVGANTPDLGGKYPNGSRKTLRLDVKVVCPVCGNVGLLVLRRRGNNLYAYVYHGYEGRRKIEHYVGKAPQPGTPEFEQFVRELEEKRVVRLVLGASEYQKLASEAQKMHTSIENLILSILRDYINKKREEALMQAIGNPTPSPSPPRNARGARGPGGSSKGGGKQWEWWKSAKRS